MTHAKLSPSRLVALLALAIAAPARAEQVVLAPRYQPGDAYLLSLDVETDTKPLSRRAGQRATGEDVQLRYRATVVVLEVDGEGRARRERHEQIQLRYERAEGSGTLFRDGAGYEVHRSADGDIRLFAGERAEQRVDREVEKIVADLLESQFEYTRLPALLDPGRPVEVGESWELDPKLARRLLGHRGLRVIEFGEPATARLERDSGADGVLVVRYGIPVSWIELERMPPDTRVADSEARLEGELRLSGDPRGRSHSQTLALRMNGVAVKSGVAPASAWGVETSRVIAQRTQVLGRTHVSGL